MRLVLLADVPLWTVPGIENLRHERHYATWLEALVPCYERLAGEVEVHWITFSKEATEVLEHQALGQVFHVIPRGSLAFAMATKFFFETRKTRKLINRINPDVIHAWGTEQAYGIAGSRSGVKARVLTLQGCLTKCIRDTGGPFLMRLQAGYERSTVRSYRFATAESPDAATALRALNADLEPEVVDYGVNPEFFDATWDPADTPRVLFVGSVSEAKGIPDLLAVANRPEMGHVEFRIVGSGALFETLSGRQTANVTWLGRCQRDQIVSELEKAWVIAIPTKADTGPTVLKEARVVGLPVITTTGAGASSYVRGAGCGEVIEPGDQDALALAISRICKDRSHCREVGRRGHEEHRITLDPKTTAGRFMEIYRKLAE